MTKSGRMEQPWNYAQAARGPVMTLSQDIMSADCFVCGVCACGCARVRGGEDNVDVLFVFVCMYMCVILMWTHVLCVFPPTHARVAFTGVNRFLADRYALKRVYVYMYIHTHTHTQNTHVHTQSTGKSICLRTWDIKYLRYAYIVPVPYYIDVYVSHISIFHISKNIYMHQYTYIYIPIHMYAHTYVHARTHSLSRAHIHTHTRARTHAHAHTRTHTHTHAHTRTHTRTHTHAHAHTRTHTRARTMRMHTRKPTRARPIVQALNICIHVCIYTCIYIYLYV